MAKTVVVVSDLHMSVKDSILENFTGEQEESFQALLTHFSSGEWAEREVELVIAGDGFDLLYAPPFLPEATTADSASGLKKIEAIISAHPDFFSGIESFTQKPNHTVIVMMGNHDIELYFADVHNRLLQAMGSDPADPAARVRFHAGQAYEPLTDVYIEHGNYYDVYNKVDIPWGQQPEAPHLHLPYGSVFVNRIYIHLKRRFPYLDRFLPPLTYEHMLALLCLLDKNLVVHLAPQLSSLRKNHSGEVAPVMPAHVDHSLAHVFTTVFKELQELKKEVFAHHQVAHAPPHPVHHHHDAIAWLDLLSGNLHGTLAHVFKGSDPSLSDTLASIAKNIMERQPEKRFVLMGHTHWRRTDIDNNERVYFNIGTWCPLVEIPDVTEIQPPLIQWLHDPFNHQDPLPHQVTMVFALLQGDGSSPTQGSVYTWHNQGYRSLVPYLSVDLASRDPALLIPYTATDKTSAS